MKNALIIPSGGIGNRFGAEIPKQYCLLEKKPIIIRTIERFIEFEEIKYIFIALNKDWVDYVDESLVKYKKIKEIIYINSGNTRAESVKNCVIESAKYEIETLFVHDAVRCNVSKNLIKNLINSSKNYNIIIPGLKSIDTLKKVENNKVERTLNRNEIYRIQTPQVIKKELYLKYLDLININNEKYSDDASIFEDFNENIQIIEGDELNIKITSKEDYEYSKYILLNNLLD